MKILIVYKEAHNHLYNCLKACIDCPSGVAGLAALGVLTANKILASNIHSLKFNMLTKTIEIEYD